jgi:hypothetical protein
MCVSGKDKGALRLERKIWYLKKGVVRKVTART